MNDSTFARLVEGTATMRQPVRRRRRLLERARPGTRRRWLLERTAAGSGRRPEVDEAAHVIRDLCMLSPDSRNGRTYTAPAMEDLRQLYEGARSYQDHPDDPTAQRSTGERLGRWHNIRLVGGKLRGDLHYDPHHPYIPSLIWAVENCPDHCGVSHNVSAEGYEDPDGHFTVTRVNEVRSVDIVDDPATTRTLMEAREIYPEHEENITMVPCHKVRGLLEDPNMRGGDLRAALEELLAEFDTLGPYADDEDGEERSKKVAAAEAYAWGGSRKRRTPPRMSDADFASLVTDGF